MKRPIIAPTRDLPAETLVEPKQSTRVAVLETVLEVPGPLLQMLGDLRLLRNVPLRYLVPEPAMLPPESARFFHVDPVFTDRLIDGVLAAGSLGTTDQGFASSFVRKVRAAVDAHLEERFQLAKGDWAKLSVTGLLLRSVAVRRWPRMHVRAWKGATQLVTLRIERIGGGILIALFAGVPNRVEIQEPDEGTRFGVEPDGAAFTIEARNPLDTTTTEATTVPFFTPDTRTIDVVKLRDAVGKSLVKLVPGYAQTVESGHLALALQQPPYAQVFAAPAHVDRFTDLGDQIAEDEAAIARLGGNP